MWFPSLSFSPGKRFLLLSIYLSHTCSLSLSFSMPRLKLSSWPLLIPFSRGFWWAPSPGEPRLSYSCLAASLFFPQYFFYPLVEAEDLQLHRCRNIANRFLKFHSCCTCLKRRTYPSLLLFFKIVGNLLYYRYMNPAIVAPDAFDIIDLSAGGQLTTEQRRNLGSIAKMLQHAASNKMFLGDNAHLNPINEYLSNSYQKFRYKWHQIASVCFFIFSSLIHTQSILTQEFFCRPDVSFWPLVTSLLWKTSSMWINTLTWSPWPSLWSTFPLGRSSTLTR